MRSRIYKKVYAPSKGRGEMLFYPGQWLTLAQVLHYLGGISAPTMHNIRRKVLNDRVFKYYGLTLVWLRRRGPQTDFQSVNYMLQKIERIERLKKAKKKRKEENATYYDRELDAYLGGKLKTGPTRNHEAIRTIRLDPFES